MAYEDRTYHGIQQGPASEGEWHPARLLVEVPEFGPTERQYGITVLRELVEPEGGGFGWGYNGGGTSAAAAAILADALDLGDPEKAGLGYAFSEDPMLADLRRTSATMSSRSSTTGGACAEERSCAGRGPGTSSAASTSCPPSCASSRRCRARADGGLAEDRAARGLPVGPPGRRLPGNW
ncbi:hypothetical protein Shyd_84580 [Streptomyces hydrogenans]|uniref:Mandelate racemase/muconate lactonizing enzyme N-terminal domain-containing protein n=1 Tax=Streptomyces hydrogenans TaxID=1873719 RepID=A0ABQ3PPY8_9ACTN|nr:DUF6166 domain-containing protein [Streptomyces hydrogenans]GHI27087.1 hypothetical protein Shyd_84580 [Streptomyces hydrogenans]